MPTVKNHLLERIIEMMPTDPSLRFKPFDLARRVLPNQHTHTNTQAQFTRNNALILHARDPKTGETKPRGVKLTPTQVSDANNKIADKLGDSKFCVEPRARVGLNLIALAEGHQATLDWMDQCFGLDNSRPSLDLKRYTKLAANIYRARDPLKSLVNQFTKMSDYRSCDKIAEERKSLFLKLLTADIFCYRVREVREGQGFHDGLPSADCHATWSYSSRYERTLSRILRENKEMISREFLAESGPFADYYPADIKARLRTVIN